MHRDSRLSHNGKRAKQILFVESYDANGDNLLLFGKTQAIVMPQEIRKIRPYARTLGQIMFDPNAKSELDDELRLTKKASRALTQAATACGLAPGLFSWGNLRADKKKILLFGRNAAMVVRLKQKQPTLKKALEEAGFTQPLEIRTLPRHTPITLGRTPAQGEARTGSPQAAQSIKKSAESLSNPALREAALRLARALEQ